MAALVVGALSASCRAVERTPTTPPPSSPAEAVLQAMLPPAGGGPIRALPWPSLQPGEWDTRTYTVSTAGPDLRAIMEGTQAAIHRAAAPDLDAGGAGLPDAYGKLVVSDWQPDLRKVALRLFWRPRGGAEQARVLVAYVHAAGRGFGGSKSGRAIETGAVEYDATCSGCHGVAGRGIPQVAPPLSDAAGLAGRMQEAGWPGTVDEFVASTIARGRAKASGAYTLTMAAWSSLYGGALSPSAADAVTAFVLNWYARAPVPDEPTPAPAGDGVPAALGGQLYGSLDCLGCHGWPGRGGITGPDLAGVAERGADRMAGVNAEGYIRVSILAPSASIAGACPSGACADMMPRDYGTRLTQREVEVLVRYMLTLVQPAPTRRPGAPPPMAGGLAPTPTPAPAVLAAARGESLYAADCRACHGELGQGGMGTALDTALVSGYPLAFTRAATGQGVPGLMPAWDEEAGGTLSVTELDAVAAYCVQLVHR